MNRELTELQLTCFNLGDCLFAVDIMRIKEIVLPQKLHGLPRASQLLEGVINLRGAVIPVMDLRKRFDMPPLENGKSGKLLIVSFHRQMVALVVDDVMEVITVSARGIKPAPDVVEGVGSEYLLGVCLSGDRVFLLLDIDTLLGPAHYQEIARIA